MQIWKIAKPRDGWNFKKNVTISQKKPLIGYISYLMRWADLFNI